MLVYGKNVALEIFNSHGKINKIYLQEHFSDKFIISAIQKCNICYEFRTKKQLDELVNGNHQGIILDVPDYQYQSLDKFLHVDDAFIIMLDHIEDPHNLGAIIRTSEAALVDAIIIPKDRSVGVNPTVMKVSAGTLQKMPIIQVTNLADTIKKLKANGFWIIGTDMKGTDYRKIDYRGKICLIIGNEGKGMSRLVKESCDFIATIPMRGQINSLNASVAAGIVIFEAIKNRD